MMMARTESLKNELTMDFSEILEAGPVAILSAAIFIIALMAYNFLRGRFWRSEDADRRAPVILECKHRPSFDTAIGRLTRVLEKDIEVRNAHFKATESFGPVAQRIEEACARVLIQVEPGTRQEKVREESRDMLVKLVMEQETTTDLLREIVQLTKASNGR